MDTAEKLFKKIESPIAKRGFGTYHLVVGINPKNTKFTANFLQGTGDLYYKRHFTDNTLYGVLEKVYNRNIR